MHFKNFCVSSSPPKPEETAVNETKSQYYGSLYRLVFHELLVQSGLEKPVSKEVPSEYPISSRLMVHLESFPEWVPGASKNSAYSENEVVVHTHLLNSVALILGKGFDDGFFSNNGFFTGVDYRLEAPVSLGSGNFRFGVDLSFEHKIDGTHEWIGTLLAVTQYDFPKLSVFHPYIRLGMGYALFRKLYTDYVSTRTPGQWLEDHYYSTSSEAAVNLVIGSRFGSREQFFTDFTLAEITSDRAYSSKINIGIQF
jgi:hypothetical protein